MDNCTYNKIKLMHELSKLNGFIQHHCIKDAKTSKHTKCAKIIKHLQKDINIHLKQLHQELSRKKL